MPLAEPCRGNLLIWPRLQRAAPGTEAKCPFGGLSCTGRLRGMKELPYFHVWDSSIGGAMFPVQGFLPSLQCRQDRLCSTSKGAPKEVVALPSLTFIHVRLLYCLIWRSQWWKTHLKAFLLIYILIYIAATRAFKYSLLWASAFLGFPAHIKVTMSWPAF